MQMPQPRSWWYSELELWCTGDVFATQPDRRSVYFAESNRYFMTRLSRRSRPPILSAVALAFSTGFREEIRTYLCTARTERSVSNGRRKLVYFTDFDIRPRCRMHAYHRPGQLHRPRIISQSVCWIRPWLWRHCFDHALILLRGKPRSAAFGADYLLAADIIHYLVGIKSQD